MQSTAHPNHQRRLEVAQALADACPPTLAQEIILTDSIQQHSAEEFLPIKLRFYTDQVNSVNPIEVWLRSTGIDVDPMSSMWRSGIEIRGRTDQFLVETGWYSFNTLYENLTPILAGQVFDHWKLVDAWRIDTAISLTDTPQISNWQERLRNYPDRLQHTLITSSAQMWGEPHWYPNSLVTLHTLRHPDTFVALSDSLHRHIQQVLRIIFAYNKVWEPDYRWLEPVLASLESQPTAFSERIQRILQVHKSGEAIDLLFELIIEVLEIVEPHFNVKQALVQAREARSVDDLYSLV